MQLADDISYLKGVGPARAKVLASEAGIYTMADLLDYLPFRYVDRSQMSTVASISSDDSFVVLQGVVNNMQTVASGPRRERLTADFTDGTGTLQLVWFQGTKWVRQSLQHGVRYLVMGHPTVFNGQWQISHPEIELAPNDQTLSTKFLPVYSTTEKMKQHGLGTRALARLTETLVNNLPPLPENLPPDIVEHFHLLPRHQALSAIHYPDSRQQLDQARTRIKFEELFFLQLDYQYAHQQRVSRSQGRIFAHVGDHFNRFYKEKIPFPLTGAQKRVIREIREDMRTGRQMNRLVQGDVGSGKTLVALMCMLLAVDNGSQACLMAPTEILATQHFYTFSRMRAWGSMCSSSPAPSAPPPRKNSNSSSPTAR